MKRLLTLTLLFGLFTTTAQAQQAAQDPPTRVLVRAVSADAKIIGSGVGGARIVVRDAETGAVLAEGIQEGGTGDTGRIMTTPRERGATVYDTEGAAGFVAELPLKRPTVVDITAYAPLGTPDALRQASKQMLVLPGHHVLGEGVILELNGLTVRLLAPEEATALSLGNTLGVRAHVTMLCGCPTEPEGLWDADRMTITARLLRGDAVVSTATLAFTGTTSTYGGVLTPDAPGVYTLEVLAADAERANFGRDTRTIVVGR